MLSRMMARAPAIVLVFLMSACSRPDTTTPAAAQPALLADSAGPSVVTGRAPIGAVVMLEPAGAEPAMPAGPAVMDQYGRQFVPDLLFVRVGQVVEFRNSEDVDHNIRVLRNPTGTTVMDVSGSQHQVFKHTFDQPGSYDVSCDVHPGMRATIVASRTPYAVGTDDRGAFTLNGVPPGEYTLRVLVSGRETNQTVTVKAPRTEVTLAGR
jgi:plastocyanin